MSGKVFWQKGMRGVLGALLITAVGACSSIDQQEASHFDQVIVEPGTAEPAPVAVPVAAPVAGTEVEARPTGGVIKRGSGVFLKPQPASAASKPADGGDITLNFEKAPLPEVVGTILGDLLQLNYVIDPRVQGTVSLHTSQPLGAGDLLPVLEAMLQANNAALVASEGFYQVVPLGSALMSGPAMGQGQQARPGAGYALQVVPLRYISAREMQRVLKPILPSGGLIEVNDVRNLLILSAPRQNLVQLLETVRMFDVDWLQGLSLGLYPLKNASTGNLIAELQKIFTLRSEGPLDGVLAFEPIERLNAVLVLSKQPRYLDEVGRLIDQLDQGNQVYERQLKVYPIRNGKAEYFAELLKQMFEGPPEQSSASKPFAQPVTRVAPEPLGSPPVPGAPPQTLAALPVARAAVNAEPAIGESRDPVSIIPDTVNNSLLVMASPRDHQTVLAALEKLEVRPRQVLIEATIAEVSLTDNLAYGLQWFLERSSGGYTGTFQFGDFTALGGGFIANLTNADGDLRVLFDALASESKLKILSSPQLMVIDNESGSIRVGDQIPIITRQTSSIEDPNAPIVSEVQFRDTGVLLQVVPHIHAGGLVRMEVNLEVSEPSADAFAAGNVSILQRSIDSSVVVQSGQTVVLGGLILENKTLTETGIPVLYKIPGLGKLFSRTVDDDRRTELMVTLTPRVIESQAEASAATEELRLRLKNFNAESGKAAPVEALPARPRGGSGVDDV